jgi:hypothetical protein
MANDFKVIDTLMEEAFPKQNKVILDPAAWSYEDFTKFFVAIGRNNLPEAMKQVVKCVVSWSYDVPLASYTKLPMTEIPAIINTVKTTLDKFIEELDLSCVYVNLDKWTMEDFFDFQQYSKSGNVLEIERLMRKVCSVSDDYGAIGNRLTFAQGAAMSRAIDAKMKDLFAAGK